jgi:hypothetical protein
MFIEGIIEPRFESKCVKDKGGKHSILIALSFAIKKTPFK